MKDFPATLCEGLRSPIFKSGSRADPSNYRGVTVLPVIEKLFEIAVQRRLEFVDEAFKLGDTYNLGFSKGSRTADNVFILQSIIERQLVLGGNVIVCFVDFSKAFDMWSTSVINAIIVE